MSETREILQVADQSRLRLLASLEDEGLLVGGREAELLADILLDPAALVRFLDKLHPREITVFRCVFPRVLGTSSRGTSEVKTKLELAQEFGVSQARIAKIKKDAISHLAYMLLGFIHAEMARSNELSSWLDLSKDLVFAEDLLGD